MKTTLLMVALLTPGLALAKCPIGQDQVFSCPTDLGGSLNICQADQDITLTHIEDGKVFGQVSVPNAQLKWKREANDYNTTDIQSEFTFTSEKVEYSITMHEIKGDASSNVADIVYTTKGEKMKFVNCLPSKPKFDHRKVKAQQSR
jgi:hypothetical protein